MPPTRRHGANPGNLRRPGHLPEGVVPPGHHPARGEHRETEVLARGNR